MTWPTRRVSWQMRHILVPSDGVGRGDFGRAGMKGAGSRVEMEQIRGPRLQGAARAASPRGNLGKANKSGATGFENERSQGLRYSFAVEN